MNRLNLLILESAVCKVFAYENKNKNKCTILPEMIFIYNQFYFSSSADLILFLRLNLIILIKIQFMFSQKFCENVMVGFVKKPGM